MVHYVRFLRTPHVAVSKKTIDISGVIAITTDLGDSLFSEDVDLVAEVVEINHPRGVLCTTMLQWQADSRALKFTIQCPGKYVSKSVALHVTTKATTTALHLLAVPEILDIWSVNFRLSDKQRTEPVVERQLWLKNKSLVRVLEETGDSIARHIWYAVSFLLKTPPCSRSKGCQLGLPQLFRKGFPLVSSRRSRVILNVG